MGRPYQGHTTPNIPRPGSAGDSREVLEDFGVSLSAGRSDLHTVGERNTLPSFPWEEGLDKCHPDALWCAHCPRWLVRSFAVFPGWALGFLRHTFYSHCHGDRPDAINHSPIAWLDHFRTERCE